MQEKTNGEPNPRPAQPSAPGGNFPVSPGDAKQLLYFILLLPGIVLSLIAASAYPLLDARVPLTLILLGFLLPVAFQAWTIARSRPGGRAGRSRAVYAGSGVALVVLALLLFLNGRLDRSPRREIKAKVVRKIAIAGGQEKQYRLAVTSLRTGKQMEDLSVAAPVYERAVVGKTVTVEVHPGFFGLPWSGSVSPN
jgi:hypothetical protein